MMTVYSYGYDEKGKLFLIAVLGCEHEMLWWFGPTGDEW